MAMSTLGSAAVMNDSVVLIFSGVVVDLCVRHKVANSLPYLLSLATTANIGSALTLTGNPQNILIVSLAYDEIGWLEFAANMVLPVTAATIINAAMMMGAWALSPQMHRKPKPFPKTNASKQSLLKLSPSRSNQANNAFNDPGLSQRATHSLHS